MFSISLKSCEINEFKEEANKFVEEVNDLVRDITSEGVRIVRKCGGSCI